MKWWRRLFGGSSDWPDPPERLIDIPESREPSVDLLRRLRGLDSRAEVVYFGRGVWLVGRVKPESQRCIDARKEILNLRIEDGFPDAGRLPELRQAILKLQGFGQVVRTDGEEGRPNPIYGEPDSILVTEFRKAMAWERANYGEHGDEDFETERVLAAIEKVSRGRSVAQWEKDGVRETFFRGRGNYFHAPARRIYTGR